MADSTFGSKYVDEDIFSEVLKTTESLSSDSAKVLLSMVYDHMYSIHDHNASGSNVLSTIAMHPAEQYEEYSGLYRAIERFELQDLSTKFGLSLTDYLSLPRDVVHMITKVVMESEKRMEGILNKPPGDKDGRR